MQAENKQALLNVAQMAHYDLRAALDKMTLIRAKTKTKWYDKTPMKDANNATYKVRNQIIKTRQEINKLQKILSKM